ncbi:hypothetical protein PYW07_002673 [Mythimna separata]|uniref:Uncharacterized protein n=1 Tax=Mythimna separata TaxID=271217 RepID=A0AAD7YGR9_MYTSE|nr:hypothetical protein PYW07_002673 [Mythimna separata]
MPKLKRTPPPSQSTSTTQVQRASSIPNFATPPNESEFINIQQRSKRTCSELSPAGPSSPTSELDDFKEEIRSMLNKWNKNQESALQNFMSKITQELTELRAQNEELQNIRTDIEESARLINANYEDIRTRMGRLESERSEQRKHIDQLEKQIQDMHANHRSAVIELRNIAPKDKENEGDLADIVLGVCGSLAVQEQVNRGYQLLKRKAEALRYRGRQVASELASTQAILGHTLREAYITLAAVKFTNGESNALVLENIGQAQIRVQRVPENISGVSTVQLQAVEEDGVGDSFRYAGLGAGGHRTGEAKKAFREAVRILVKFASLRNTCLLLDEAIRTTLRKVNGIEKVIMPKLRNTENYIMTEMDEREREEFHRLKMVKAKKVKTRARLLLRQSSSGFGAGEAQDEAGDESCTKLPTRLQSLECLTGILTCNSTLSMTTESGDFKPICYPHNWDDDDLLF